MTPYTTTPVVISADAPDEGEMQAVAVMTLRDVFAAKAMLGFIAEPLEGVQEACFLNLSERTCNAIAKSSYAMADAMLKARQQ